MKAAERIHSRSNPLLVLVHKLARDGAAYRRQGQLWVEGEHLCAAARQRGLEPEVALLSEDAAASALSTLADGARRVVVVPAPLFGQVSGLESPAGIGFLLPLPAAPAIEPHAPSIVLDRVQDAGNVGSVLRSAAAFGVRQVLALGGTAALWSPKVLRAGMGAHFGLRLIEGLAERDLDVLAVPLLATSPHAGRTLADAPLPQPCAWVLGHEGQGVATSLLARCALTLRIPQPGGEESLNVAAAAAVCLYESVRRQ